MINVLRSNEIVIDNVRYYLRSRLLIGMPLFTDIRHALRMQTTSSLSVSAISFLLERIRIHLVPLKHISKDSF
jgi:hypothetical protein